MVRHDWAKEDYREYRNAQVRKSQKLRRDIARGNGMCIICCKAPAREYMSTCFECSTRIAKRNRERRQAQKEQAND